ncbi:MAG: hypothetical protein SFX74_05605 [Fimbriimonadaceae bacterium]|nr:hypothetical protein [Fimbriimonadaceae bacterium]
MLSVRPWRPLRATGPAAPRATELKELIHPEAGGDDRSKFVRYARTAAKLMQYRREGALVPGEPKLERVDTPWGTVTIGLAAAAEIPMPVEPEIESRDDRLRMIEATRTQFEPVILLATAPGRRESSALHVPAFALDRVEYLEAARRFRAQRRTVVSPAAEDYVLVAVLEPSPDRIWDSALLLPSAPLEALAAQLPDRGGPALIATLADGRDVRLSLSAIRERADDEDGPCNSMQWDQPAWVAATVARRLLNVDPRFVPANEVPAGHAVIRIPLPLEPTFDPNQVRLPAHSFPISANLALPAALYGLGDFAA